MSAATIGIVHPGAMGAAVGAMARQGGARVLWASAGRSVATAERARDAGMEDLGDLPSLARSADVLLSVCPPHAAVDLAREVAGTGFAGTYVDANAIAPETVERVAAVAGEQVRFVDGAIVGPPPARPGTTRLYLSGADAAGIAAVFDGTALEALVLEGPPGRASALKICFSAYTKGSTALLTIIRALARRHGVDDALLDEWAISHPELSERATARPLSSARKGWRFSGEMREIAASLRAAGLPPGALDTFAEVYDRLSGFKDASETPSIDDVLDAVSGPAPSTGDQASGARAQAS